MSYDEIKSIGIIGLGTVGRAVYSTIVGLLAEKKIDIENIYLANRSPGMAFKSLRGEKRSSKTKFNLERIQWEDIEDIYEQSDVVFTCVGNKFGDNPLNIKKSFLEQELDKIKKLKSTGDWSKEQDREFQEAEAIYKCLESTGLKFKDETRLFCWLPYTLPVITYLAKRRKGKSVQEIILSNPPDILSYVNALYSNIIMRTKGGGNHYDTFRIQNVLLPEKLEEESETEQERRGDVWCVGDHGGGMIPLLSNSDIKIPLSEVLKLKKRFQKDLVKYHKRIGTPKHENKIILEDLLSRIFNGGDVGLSVFTKLEDLENFFDDSLTIREDYKTFKKTDQGSFIGWVMDGSERLELTLDNWESEQFFLTYVKLYGILEALRTGGFIEGYIQEKETHPWKSSGRITFADTDLDSNISGRYEIVKEPEQTPSSDLIKDILKNLDVEYPVPRSRTQNPLTQDIIPNPNTEKERKEFILKTLREDNSIPLPTYKGKTSPNTTKEDVKRALLSLEVPLPPERKNKKPNGGK